MKFVTVAIQLYTMYQILIYFVAEVTVPVTVPVPVLLSGKYISYCEYIMCYCIWKYGIAHNSIMIMQWVDFVNYAVRTQLGISNTIHNVFNHVIYLITPYN